MEAALGGALTGGVLVLAGGLCNLAKQDVKPRALCDEQRFLCSPPLTATFALRSVVTRLACVCSSLSKSAVLQPRRAHWQTAQGQPGLRFHAR